ncbi:hypothetical protein [Patulibacter sp. SYSU D01012]|uniref:hypothetical protein n=1 Tax=Patulibacter sp. SYSU D01012 TaxID=2817381 RepID=UPI001FEFC4B8|nr:hypothetical protein [Patulibacter sp. SYSU D01012]
MPRRWRMPLLLLGALLTVGVVLLPEILGPGVLTCAPAVALVLALALHRYPGERRLVRWLSRRRGRRRVAVVVLGRSRRGHPPAAQARGGRLMGTSMAVRPPPAHG